MLGESSSELGCGCLHRITWTEKSHAPWQPHAGAIGIQIESDGFQTGHRKHDLKTFLGDIGFYLLALTRHLSRCSMLNGFCKRHEPEYLPAYVSGCAFSFEVACLRGRFLRWEANSNPNKPGHFVAVIVSDAVTLIDDGVATTRHTVADFGRPDLFLWWQMLGLHEDVSQPHALSIEQQSMVDQKWAAACHRNAGKQPLSSSCGLSHASGLGPVQRQRIEANHRIASHLRGLRLIRPLPPLGWRHPIVPSTVSDFDRFDVHLPRITFLTKYNAHPRDRHIVFYEDTHTYLVRGVPTMGSVTGLVHVLAQTFDADKAIASMRSGRRWPRPGYLQPELSNEVLDRLKSLPAASPLVSLLEAPSLDEEAVCFTAAALAATSQEIAEAVQGLALTPAQIKQKWDANCRDAAHRGTWMHYRCEAWLNRIPVDDISPEFTLFLGFVYSLGGLTAYRTEWVIYSEAERLAGSIDFVAIDCNGHLALFDWKRSKDLRSKFQNRFSRMQIPLDHLDDCAGNHYKLQLNLYRWMLETHYGVVVRAMYIVGLHPDNGENAFVYEVPRMQAEVDVLLQIQRHRVREQEGETHARNTFLHNLSFQSD